MKLRGIAKTNQCIVYYRQFGLSVVVPYVVVVMATQAL